MTVQFNTDKTISGKVDDTAPFIAQINTELDRFSSHISRIEVHLSNENGNKDGQADIRCMLEARQEGRQPIAVSCQAHDTKEAVTGAIDKLKTSLETVAGKQKNY